MGARSEGREGLHVDPGKKDLGEACVPATLGKGQHSGRARDGGSSPGEEVVFRYEIQKGVVERPPAQGAGNGPSGPARH